MKAQQQHREKFIDFVQNKLFDVFAKENIQAQIDSRIKHYFSIYRKLKRKNKNYVNELYDIVALRVVLEDVIDREQKYDYSKCYTTLGTIHKYWTPLTQRFKDYIAIPKGNGYKSLHTTVIGLGGKEFIHPTEIQIRTKQMHFESEFGIAAHWEYKENEVDLILSDKKQEWVKNLVSLHQDWHSNDEFLENLKIDIFKDRIFILTPRGDVKDLPQGATPIDFAYAVHSDLGHRFNGALVNDNIVPLDYKLQNGDIVKIISKKEAHPNLYWLSSVITNTAKSRIKQWFKSQDKDNLIKEGKILLNKQLERNNLPELPLNLSTIDLIHNKKLAMKERLEVLEQVGSGAVSPMLIVKKLIEKNKLLQRIKLQVPLKKNENPKSKLEVLIKGEQGYETRIAGCCSPQSSDQIVGFITKGTGIAIHKTSCVFIKKQINSSRIIEATWNCNEKETKLYKIIIESKTKTNSINDVIKIVTSYNIEVKSISTAEKKTNSIIHLKFKHSNFETVNKIFDRIEELPWVKMVKKEE
jgi:GTP pyrophosphokinase